MGHIFISYSHKDKDYVHKLQEALQNEGLEVWIDGRIDYGSEWPKVIQEHLDTCEAFLVVMSKNSFESDMVQNEVTRAREKNKPIFPLLLDGENWLIVQTKQYVDVKGGILPPNAFFHKLEDYAERINIKLSHDLATVTFSWLTYTSPNNNFLFQYPPESEIYRDEECYVCIGLPIIPRTNILKKQVTISCAKKNNNAPNSPDPEFGASDGFLVNRQIVNIAGTRYLREVYSDAAMSKGRELTKYSTLDAEIITAFALEMIISNQGPHAYLLPKMDIDAEREVILYILHTFSWLD